MTMNPTMRAYPTDPEVSVNAGAGAAVDFDHTRKLAGRGIAAAAGRFVSGAGRQWGDLVSSYNKPGQKIEVQPFGPGTVTKGAFLAKLASRVFANARDEANAAQAQQNLDAKNAYEAAITASVTDKMLHSGDAKPAPVADVPAGLAGTLNLPTGKVSVPTIQAAASALASGRTEHASVYHTDHPASGGGGSGGDIVPLTPEAIKMLGTKTRVEGSAPTMGMGNKATSARNQAYNEAAAQLKASGDSTATLATNKANYKADSGSLAKLQASTDAFTAFTTTAHKNITILTDAMKLIPNTNSPVLNRPLRAIDLHGLGSAEMAAYNTARRVVAPEIARILTQVSLTGQLTDEAQRHVDHMMNGDYSLNQMVAVIDVLQKDMANRGGSLSGQLSAIKARISGAGAGVTHRWQMDAAGNLVEVK